MGWRHHMLHFVLDLECYGENHPPYKNWSCLWTSRVDSPENWYTLVIIQNKRNVQRCSEYNISASPTPLAIKRGTLYEDYNMTVHVFDKSHPSSCPKASFEGLPKHLIRCGPPKNTPTARGTCTVENLQPSLSYVAQIRCSLNNNCPLCPWSAPYSLPPELNVQPVIVNVEDVDIAGTNGRRLLRVHWKFPSGEPVQGYRVHITKASGEPAKEAASRPASHPELRLVVSYSAYHLNIQAFNEASTSPALSYTIPARKHTGGDGGKLNVTFHSNASLTLSWRDTLVPTYICYSIELSARGRKTQYLMFYEASKNHKRMHLKEPLEPYRRYDITLHTRLNRDSCNMKRINNSEQTYGSLQAYFREGSPVGAPTNVTSHNVTLTSAVLTWQAVPEEDVGGFLLGYTLRYKEYGPTHTSPERNVTVEPTLRRKELVDLKSGTMYVVQISAFTQAGEGVKKHFVLHAAVAVPLAMGAVVICMMLSGAPLLKRAERSFWPSVPNPGTSNAIQRMNKSYELEPLKPLTSTREECHTCTLHLPSPRPTLLLRYTGLEGPSRAPSRADPSPRDTSDELTGDVFLPDDNEEEEITATSDTPRHSENAPGTFHSDYTTIEFFQQVTAQLLPGLCDKPHGPSSGGDKRDSQTSI
ncbi:hypothetical protein NHX12_027974 [Muraenolepis orangiensis]|uniref:Fibronectin type-III domain-containing protein n=1 Tax=Muraenolepis orangiensis TaxID=630683 RepID=A0A9Q0EFP0_9TELE|nr:hypothetical protein NHX12_027974 [Muraenolepis orangiensis]